MSSKDTSHCKVGNIQECTRMVFDYRIKDQVNMEKLREKIGMFSVNQLNCYHVYIEAFNIINYGSSEKILEKWRPKDHRVYSNRRQHDVKVPKVDHVRCQGFSYYAAKMWNNLPVHIKEIKELNQFKARIKNHIWDVIPFYYIRR